MFIDWGNFVYPEFYTLNSLVDESYCFYNGPKEDSTNEYGYEDPCLLYYEEFTGDGSTGASCALCKYNAIRITTILNADLPDKWSTVCGYTDYDPDAPGAFDLLVSLDPSIRCNIDTFYVNRLSWTDTDLEREFYPTESMFNSTTGAWEIVCVEPDIFVDESCESPDPVLANIYTEHMTLTNPVSYEVYQ